MNTSKKIISLLMCMLMVLSIVPMSVFATVGPIEIDTVHIEGVPAPVYGQTVEEYYTAILDERGGGTLTVNDETFNKSAGKYGNLFDEGLEVKKNDTVLDSTSTELITEGNYYVAMTLYPADGYVIPADVAVTVDGAASVETDFDEYGALIAYAKYEVKATEIDIIHIEGVPAPVYGQTIKSYYEAIEAKITDGTITVNDEVYDSTAYKYGNLFDDGWNVRTEADGCLDSTSTNLIKEGTYYVAMWFYPDNGYVIPEDVNVIFDGAKSVKIELDSVGCLDIRAEFEVKCPHAYDNDCDAECNLCPATRTITHTYDNACDAECNVCKATRTPAAHKGGTATCKAKAKCTVCGKEYGSLAGHSLKKVSAKDSTCTATGNIAHYKCSKCSKLFSDSAGKKAITSVTVAKKAHTYKTTVSTKATLSKNGKTVEKCSCGAVKSKSEKTVYYPKTIKLSKTAYTYNGKVQTPSVTVKDSKGNTLKKDTDYTVKYASGRKATGKYTVTITFKGKYSGTKTLSYNILPSKTSKISITSATTSLKATWKKVTGATGYKVELLNSKGKVVKSVTTTKLTYTFSKLSKVTTYKVKVTAYKTIDKKAVYSTASTTVTTSTAPAAVTLSKVTAGSKQATVAWKTVSGASGYEVMYSTSSKFKSAKTATVKKGSTAKTTIKKLTKGKKYYFKVRAYKTVDGAKVYGAWSAVKSAKVK